MKKGGPPNKKPRYNYCLFVHLHLKKTLWHVLVSGIVFFDRFNDEDEPSHFEDELALLDEIEMEMQDNFDEHDGTAGDYAWRFFWSIKYMKTTLFLKLSLCKNSPVLLLKLFKIEKMICSKKIIKNKPKNPYDIWYINQLY